MVIWRISNHADLSGAGGLRSSGRWHRRGAPVVCLAEHPALAILEVLVDFELAPGEVPDGIQILRLVRAPSFERIDNGDSGFLEIDPIPCRDGQPVHEGRRSDQAVLDRHRPTRCAETGDQLGPAQAGGGIPRQAVQASDTLGEPAFEPCSPPAT